MQNKNYINKERGQVNMNKEITLYDVIEHIKQSEILLEQFIESEELDVEDLCQQLNDIAYTIKETLD